MQLFRVALYQLYQGCIEQNCLLLNRVNLKKILHINGLLKNIEADQLLQFNSLPHNPKF